VLDSAAMRVFRRLPWLWVGAFGLLLPGCAPPTYPQRVAGNWQRQMGAYEARGGTVSFTPPPGEMRYTTMAGMAREIRLRADLVPRGTHSRKTVRPMKPQFITIHATANPSADAAQHSLALKRGALKAPKRRGGNRIGYLVWHFTVDDHEAIQHLPVSEQGEHADFDGPGNRYSIGIEMCENRGGDFRLTLDRPAKLAAVLYTPTGTTPRQVVAHYPPARHGQHPPNKNCPHMLLDGGRPGPKWRAFLSRVNYHYRRLHPPKQ